MKLINIINGKITGYIEKPDFIEPQLLDNYFESKEAKDKYKSFYDNYYSAHNKILSKGWVEAPNFEGESGLNKDIKDYDAKKGYSKKASK